MNKVYTDEQILFIREHATLKDKEIHQAFNERFGKDVSFAAIRKLRQRSGIKKKNGRPYKGRAGSE